MSQGVACNNPEMRTRRVDMIKGLQMVTMCYNRLEIAIRAFSA